MRKSIVLGTLILLFVLMGTTGCQSHITNPSDTVSTTSSQNQQPVEVTSVIGPIPPYNPGGPTVKITLKNVGDSPVTYLKATLQLERAYEFDFVSVTPSSPLLPGESSSATLNLIGPGSGFSTDTSYPLEINIMLQSGAKLVYTKQVQIGTPPPNN